MLRKRSLALVLALCLLLLGACTAVREPQSEAVESEEPNYEVELWYLDSELLAGELGSIGEAYNQTAPLHPLRLRGFESEESLARALDSARPELLFCEQRRAFSLYEQGRLKELHFSEPLAYTAMFSELSGSVGSAYFPLGAEIPLLAVSKSLGEAPELSTVERLCTAAAAYADETGRPFFSADSYAVLFDSCLRQNGTEFSGVREQDLENEEYRYLYNLLAEAAYEGGLMVEREKVLPLVKAGTLPCALVMSSELSEGCEELWLRPLPVLAGGTKLCMGRSWGLAVTPAFDNRLEGTADFLRWLASSPEAVEPLLRRGIVPASGGAWPEDEDALSSVMAEAAGSYTIYLPESGSGYVLNGEDFDRDFFAALALLTKG